MSIFKKKQRSYTCNEVEQIINAYIEKGGELIELIPGTLGYGLTVLQGYNLKTVVIKEFYINCWTSGHKVRLYNKTPQKYQSMIDAYYENLERG